MDAYRGRSSKISAGKIRDCLWLGGWVGPWSFLDSWRREKYPSVSTRNRVLAARFAASALAGMSSVSGFGSSDEYLAIYRVRNAGRLRICTTSGLRTGQARPGRAGVFSRYPPYWLRRVTHTHTHTPCFPSLFPFTLTHLDGRDRVGGSDGNLGASRRGGTTELSEWIARGHPSSSPPLTLLLVHSESYGELVVVEERARPVSIAWLGLRLGRFRSVVAAGRCVRLVAECHVQTCPFSQSKNARVTSYRG
jgi:hypothetical protein